MIGNGKSPLRNLMGEFAEVNGRRGFTADDAMAGVRYRGLKWERQHVLTALRNMVTDGQLWARWENTTTGRRFFPHPPQKGQQ